MARWPQNDDERNAAAPVGGGAGALSVARSSMRAIRPTSTSLTTCPICGSARPANRAGGEPWCCSIACYRTFHRLDRPEPMAQGVEP